MRSDHAQADLLSDQVQAARTRMLFTHIPVGTSIAGVLALLIGALMAYLVPSSVGVASWCWLLCTLAAVATRVRYSLRYFKSKDRRNPKWLRGMNLSTFAFSLTWAAMLWVWPPGQHYELLAAQVGAVVGIAAVGSFMLTVHRTTSRLWLVPMLVSAAICCGVQGTVLGGFGALTVSGFLGVLWIETGRAHRRIGELLYLRFTSDRVTASQAAALREAEALSQAKGQFVATMSHEMRTPLHGILGLSRLIRSELHSQDAHERLNLLEAAGHHLLGVINDVLDYSKLQAGRLTLAPSVVDLRAVVQEVTALAAVNGMEKGLDVTLECDLPAHYPVEVDAGRLKQILHNLLGNAVKFTERGQVVMRLREVAPARGAPSGVCLEVQDSGIGVPPGELNRIFEAFHQVDGGYERKANGSGLGLSIAREICLAMGGDLSCESHVGRGSIFRCVLPLRRLDMTELNAPAASPASSASREAAGKAALQAVKQASAQRVAWRQQADVMVLLVEDNPVNAIVARSELEQMGLSVAVAENGHAALAWLAEHQAALVLMDCHMPEMNGFDATRRIRAIESERGDVPVPIVALTASTQDEVQLECLSAGMNECLSKPFMRADLLKIVRRYVPSGRQPIDLHEHMTLAHSAG